MIMIVIGLIVLSAGIGLWMYGNSVNNNMDIQLNSLFNTGTVNTGQVFVTMGIVLVIIGVVLVILGGIQLLTRENSKKNASSNNGSKTVAKPEYIVDEHDPNKESSINFVRLLGKLSIIFGFLFNICGLIIGCIGIKEANKLLSDTELSESYVDKLHKAKNLNYIGVIVSTIISIIGFALYIIAAMMNGGLF